MAERIYAPPVAEMLIDEIATELDISRDVCERVVRWSYKNIREAVHHHNSIELSGFGSLVFSPTKGKKKMRKLRVSERILEKENKESSEKKLHNVRENIEYLERKICQTDG